MTRIWWSPPTRARPPSPTSPTASRRSTASGWATPSPRAARSAMTTRPWASPPAAPGSRSSATSASSAIDTQTEDFTVVGIGDMAGDVFGNGMLLSQHIRLVAAFNHLHIFIDPNPDPATSFAERRRLFELPALGLDRLRPHADLGRRRRLRAHAPRRSRSVRRRARRWASRPPRCRPTS